MNRKEYRGFLPSFILMIFFFSITLQASQLVTRLLRLCLLRHSTTDAAATTTSTFTHHKCFFDLQTQLARIGNERPSPRCLCHRREPLRQETSVVAAAVLRHDAIAQRNDTIHQILRQHKPSVRGAMNLPNVHSLVAALQRVGQHAKVVRPASDQVLHQVGRLLWPYLSPVECLPLGVRSILDRVELHKMGPFERNLPRNEETVRNFYHRYIPRLARFWT
uniref:Uncharacterized protein n=1 Tax=Anopheles atroparvus TaxID=41427 RepID=A0A182JJ38_ANOAO